ncbi:hypothetical protein [Escherichia phage ZCEC12]|uniref:hypothetical protein n=1 Tax=Escherichia phage ZCEC10 TaxID=2894588 RepID=UPI00240E4F39|nr:hypothetical protein P9622_gp68 [Escherichia phage ZCEC10]UJQ87851.1 hypothetical protein [Escherichia phage ZCEC11]UJQ87943.1 hypothetical protein [Escherichia phage ZCEC12]UJQ88018.1 hypothetical protein [Escherichia phage ZCEC10]
MLRLRSNNFERFSAVRANVRARPVCFARIADCTQHRVLKLGPKGYRLRVSLTPHTFDRVTSQPHVFRQYVSRALVLLARLRWALRFVNAGVLITAFRRRPNVIRERAFHNVRHSVKVEAQVFSELQERRDAATIAQSQFARLTDLA